MGSHTEHGLGQGEKDANDITRASRIGGEGHSLVEQGRCQDGTLDSTSNEGGQVGHTDEARAGRGSTGGQEGIARCSSPAAVTEGDG